MKKVFKWVGIVLGSLVGLILVAGVALFAMGNARLNKKYDFQQSTRTRRDTTTASYHCCVI